MTKGASYLDRPSFSLTAKDLSAWGPPALALATLAAIGLVYLALAGAYLAMNVEHKRLSGTGPAAEAAPAADERSLAEPDDSDPDGTKYVTFNRGSQNHYIRQNDEAGQILIITGLVKNSYPEPRSFIRLRGFLLSNDGTNLSDRFVYAGNTVSDSELKTLPIREILARLSTRGGQDGRNINIRPEAEIPFMIVFDKLPDGMSEYRIDPVGSSPAQ